MTLLLWSMSVMLLISGLGLLVRGQLLWGIGVILAALAVGPGGVFLFT